MAHSDDFPLLPVTYETPAEVATRLYALDPALTPEVLRAAVDYALSYFADCTRYDPASTAGFLLWAKAIRALRERLCPQGWKAVAQQNYPTVEHPVGTFAISMAGGDEATGIASSIPTTRTEKGRVTRNAIAQNQSSMWTTRPSLAPPVKETWLLLIHVDTTNEVVRYELSLPLGMDEDNHVSYWRERIILQAFPFDPTPIGRRVDDDDNGPIEIDVQLRAS